MKKIVVFLSIVFSVVLLTVAVSAADMSVVAGDNRVFDAKDNSFYLPSYVKPNEVKIIHDASGTMTYKNAKGQIVDLPSGTVVDLTPFKTIAPNGQISYMLSVYDNGYLEFFVFNFANNLPSVHVDTTLGRDTIVKNNGKDTLTKVTIVNKDGSYEYNDTDATNSEFKVRGNTTKDYAKKPFQIKLSQKTDLFDMGEGKSWILLANYLDQSNIRNSIMYKIAELFGMHSSKFQSVDLYIDGQYYGIYLLCEKVQISSTRVDILELEKLNDALNPTYQQTTVSATMDSPILREYTYIPGVKNPEDITGGYLVELDNNYWRNELCYFVTNSGNHYVIKSPEYASEEQVKYISTLFGEMEAAIMSSTGYNHLGKHYSEYMDVDSFAYAYIIAEFSRNYDAGSSSMYFYKDADQNGEYSKIIKGPLWDCDNTLGNIHKNGASNTEGYWARGRNIWSGLTQHSEFNTLVTKELARVYDDIFDMIDVGGFVYDQVDEIGQSIYMERARWHSDNYSKWPTYYDGTHYDRWQSAPVFNFVDGYYSNNLDKDNTTVIGYLCEHIEARLNWLATEWGCNVTLRERCFEIKNNKIQISSENVNALIISARALLPFSSSLSKIKLDIIGEMVESGEVEIIPAQATLLSCETEDVFDLNNDNLVVENILVINAVDIEFLKKNEYV